MGRIKIKKRPYMPVKAKTAEYGTPNDIYESLNEEFNFTLDAAASKENAKCKIFYTKEQDGTKQSWENHTVWLNPPYDSKSLKCFTRKTMKEQMLGVTTVMFMPAKTDQEWWHKLWGRNGVEVRWIRGRVKFIGAKHGASFPSVVIIVRGYYGKSKKSKAKRKKAYYKTAS